MSRPFSTFSHPHWVGFNSLFSELEKAASLRVTYPPHNIVRLSEDQHLIELAVAGFREEDISIETHDNILSVSGKSTDQREYAYKGISTRDFEREFVLAEHVEVKEATYYNGILQIYLVRNVPDEKKPRKIEIKK